MIFEKPGASRAELRVYRVLCAVFAALLLSVLAGTIYGLVKKRPAAVNESQAQAEDIFSGLGTIRVETAGEAGESLIVSIVFPYDGGDRAFSEELVSRIEAMKALTVEYLGSFTAEALQETDLALIGDELLRRYNGLFRLGRIQSLYFLEFIWL